MSSNNNDNSAIGAAIGFAAIGMAVMALFLFAAFAFLALILTILSLIAWNRPLAMGKWIITPQEARGFILRGLAGLWLAPAFILFCDVIFQLGVNWNYLPHMMGVGYVLGSVGWETITLNSSAAEPQVEILPPARQIQHQPNEPAPFRYASWDDEEEFRS